MEARRLTSQEEKDLMYDTTNENNLGELKNMLSSFYLSPESSKLVREGIDTNFKNILGWNSLTRKLKLNDQLRAFYKIPADEESDKSYKIYWNRLYNARLLLKQTACTCTGSLCLCNNVHPNVRIIENNGLLDYDVYLAGRFTHKKQHFKLFKWLLQKHILTKEEIEEITTARNNQKEQIVMVSRNPVDYLFISTNQNFSSCMNFYSTSEGCYWLNYPATFVDKDRFLIAVLPDTKLRTHIFKNEFEFKHFKYRSRSWYLWLKDGDGMGDEFMHKVSWYPHESSGLHRALTKYYGFEFKEGPYYNSKSYHDDSPNVYFEDNTPSMCYIDSIGILWTGKTHYYIGGGKTGEIRGFDFEGDFNELHSFNDALENSIECYECGSRVREDEVCSVDGYSYCEACYGDLYSYCDICNNDVSTDMWNHTHDCCDDCAEELYDDCDICRESTLTNDLRHHWQSDTWCCPDCYNTADEWWDEENDKFI